MTAEIKDTYEAFYETQTDATTKHKLSKLETDIQAHISTSARDKLENAITGSEKDVKINPSELIRSIYSQRMTRDIMMKHLGAGKTQKLSLGDKIRQKIKDRGADILLKQKNSYDAVLTQMEAPVIEQFKAELDDLKKSIVVAPAATDENTTATNETSTGTNENEWYAEKSHYTDEEKKQIDAVIAEARKFEGTTYAYGGTTKKGIDCSWLRSMAFKEQYKDEGATFGRLTAALFDSKAPDIKTADVEKGDWMFREDPKGVSKGGKNEKWMKIYHIEMALWKPFEKDGKRYVKTYGSSSDKEVTDGKGKPLKSENGGTGYRIREIRDNHHFAKPTYYEKLVAMKKNNESEYKNVA